MHSTSEESYYKMLPVLRHKPHFKALNRQNFKSFFHCFPQSSNKASRWQANIHANTHILATLNRFSVYSYMQTHCPKILPSLLYKVL